MGLVQIPGKIHKQMRRILKYFSTTLFDRYFLFLMLCLKFLSSVFELFGLLILLNLIYFISQG